MATLLPDNKAWGEPVPPFMLRLLRDLAHGTVQTEETRRALFGGISARTFVMVSRTAQQGGTLDDLALAFVFSGIDIVRVIIFIMTRRDLCVAYCDMHGPLVEPPSARCRDTTRT
jgi:hypothetical protein